MRNFAKRFGLLAVVMIVVALSVTAANTSNSVVPQQQTVGGPMDENSPLLLFVAAYANEEAQHSKTASRFTKWRIHRYAYNLAYKQSRNAGFSRSGAYKYATAFIDGGDIPSLVCKDYESGAPPDCKR